MKILIVDDHPTNLKLLRATLQSMNHSAIEAADGVEAMKILKTQEVDAVISDILMPNMDGYRFCAEVRNTPGIKETRIILYSNTYLSPGDRELAMRFGADVFLEKPASAEQIDQVIREAMSRSPVVPSSDPSKDLGTLKSYSERLIAKIEEKNLELTRRTEELGVSEEKYRRLMDQANDAIFVGDEAGIVVEANQRMEALVGRPRAEMIGRHFTELLPPGERDQARTNAETLFKTGALRLPDSRLLRADGTLVNVDLSVSVVRLGGGVNVLAIAHDMTERNLLERQLHEAQKMEAVGQLAGGIAHDFNNLLTVIDGYASFLLEEQEGGKDWRDGVIQIQRAVDRSAALTRQLLAFGRRQVLAPRNLDLNAVLNDMSGLIRLLLGETVKLVTVPAADLPAVHADSGQLEQVIMNLVANARDAMPKGGRLTLATGLIDFGEEEARAAGGLSPGRFVSLTVSDTGTGMASDVKARVFEPFFTTKEKGRGTGLGLSTAYGIVRQSGGQITVDSEPGRGASFRILLPVVAARAAERHARPERAPSPRGTETILLVEDESAIRDLVSRSLGRQGYRVIASEDADGALSSAREGRADLLITDVVMPGISGPDLASTISGIIPGLRVLYMSGYAQDGIVQHGRMESGFAFIQKPFTPDALARKVREVLDLPRPPA